MKSFLIMTSLVALAVVVHVLSYSFMSNWGDKILFLFLVVYFIFGVLHFFKVTSFSFFLSISEIVAMIFFFNNFVVLFPFFIILFLGLFGRMVKNDNVLY